MAIEVKREEDDSSYEETSYEETSYTSEDEGSDMCINCIGRQIDLELELLSIKLEKLEKRLKDYYNADNEETELVSDLYKSVQQIQELNSNLKE